MLYRKASHNITQISPLKCSKWNRLHIQSELTQIIVLGQLPTNSGWTLIGYKELRVTVKGETLYRGQNGILYQDINMLLNGVKLGLYGDWFPFCHLVVISGTAVFLPLLHWPNFSSPEVDHCLLGCNYFMLYFTKDHVLGIINGMSLRHICYSYFSRGSNILNQGCNRCLCTLIELGLTLCIWKGNLKPDITGN